MTDLAVRSSTRAAKQSRWRLGLAALVFLGYFGLAHIATSANGTGDAEVTAGFFLVPAGAFFMCAVLVSLGSRVGWLLGLLATTAMIVVFGLGFVFLFRSPDAQHVIGYSIWFCLHIAFFAWVAGALLSQQATVTFVRRSQRWVDDEPEEEAVAVSSLFVWPEGHIVGRVGAAAESGGVATAVAETPVEETPAKHRRSKRSFEPPTWAHMRRRVAIVLTLCLGGLYGLVAYNSGWLDRPASFDGARTLSLADMPGYQLQTHPTPSFFYGQCRADNLLDARTRATGQAAAFGRPGYYDAFAFEMLFSSTGAPTLYQQIITRAASCQKQDTIAWKGAGRVDRPARIVAADGPKLGDRSTWWRNTKADPPVGAPISVMPGESLQARDPSRPRWIVLVMRGDTIMQLAAPTQAEAAGMAEAALRG